MRRRPTATQGEATATVPDDGSMTHEPVQTSSGPPLCGEAPRTRTTIDTRPPLTGQPSSARSHGSGDPRHEESSGELLAGHSEVGRLPRPAERLGQDPPPWACRVPQHTKEDYRPGLRSKGIFPLALQTCSEPVTSFCFPNSPFWKGKVYPVPPHGLF